MLRGVVAEARARDLSAATIAESLRKGLKEAWRGVGPGGRKNVGSILIDVRTDDMGAVVAELRVFKAREGDEPTALGGTLRMPGVGAWSVACDGGEG